MGVKKPRGIRHDRHCQSCRSKGIKCDLNRPRCQPCLQSGVACHYPRRVVWMEEKKESTTPKIASNPSSSLPSKTSPVSTCLSPSNPTTKDAQKPQPNTIPINLYGFIDMLSHYYQEIKSSNSDLPDEAIQLISRTLSFARSRLEGNDDKQSIQSHLVALSNLSKVIDSGHPIALFGIATFAIFEVCCGSFGKWTRHLQGARSLLDLHCRNKSELDNLTRRIPGLADVLAYLVWFDVTGALVSDCGLMFDDWHRGILTPAFFGSVGCPGDTFDLFARLVKGDCDNTLDLCSLAMDQVLALDSDSTDRGLAVVVYRGAGAIVAFSRAGENDNRSTIHPNTISSIVDRVCDAISRMPATSRFYVHLATPAFLTGMHACTRAQCEVLRGYWRNCQSCEFPRYPDGEEQCERRWRSRSIY